MPAYASGIYHGNSTANVGKIYHGEDNQVSRVYNCEDTDYVPEKVPFNAEVLIIGGGGGGGSSLGGGGGGAGGYRTFTKKYYTGKISDLGRNF